LLAALFSAALLPRAFAADDPAETRKGTAHFEPARDEARLPERFRMQAHSIPFEQKPLQTISKVMKISAVTFPSPMVTPHENNNTVHCEYFLPSSPGRKPGVIVLHILGGDFDLARLFARSLAGRGVAALFLKMPYYGERRQPGIDARMISLDPEQTVRGMTQAALDIRQGAAFLASQPEVDPQQLGIMGISLGGITAALSASLEPRFTKVCLILAGGDMGEIAWTSTEMAPLRKAWAEAGRSKEELFSTIKVVDPVTYARPVAGRKMLMLNASHDEVVPPACTISLWHAFGDPEIVWWDAGHYSAVRYIFSGMARTVGFFESDKTADSAQTIAK
jgi:cephalosporin-C deacetylase-like acetyl esterase